MTAAKRSVLRKFFKATVAALGVFLALAILALLILSFAYRDISQAASAALSGKEDLNAAYQALRARNWPEAISRAAAGRQAFSEAAGNIASIRANAAVRFLPPIKRQIDDLEYLLQTGEVLGRSLESLLPVLQGVDQIRAGATTGSFYDLPASEKERFIRYVFESEPELAGLRANLKLALLNIERIHRVGIFWPVYGQISDLKSNLEQAVRLLDLAEPLVKILPALAGYPDASRYLIIMQNNDELRPSGGFVGVYGRLDVKSGEIKYLETDDSYHVDMPASSSDKWQVPAPDILAKYLEVEKLYFRDANWSPDWPQSARQLEYVYNGVIGANNQPAQPFTAIVGITPDLIANLIRLVGPIAVRGATYNADNFQSLLQYNVEVAYREQNISPWDRKDVIDELLAELKARLLKLPASQLPDLLSIAESAIREKDFQIYFPNSYWQQVADELGASGRVAKTPGDYLMVVDANLAAFKSDSVMQKDISYQVVESARGLEAKVRLRYKHEGGFDWRTTRYRSYTRILAPRGSRLVSLDGVDEETANPSAGDDEELAKAVFGFFFTVEPGSEREITLSYTLPDEIYQQWRTGQYQLLVQKQAGRRTRELRVDLLPLTGPASSWTKDLKSDKSFTR